MSVVAFLHVTSAIFLVGPAVIVSSATAGAIRSGPGATVLVSWLARSTRVYGGASVLVFLLGLWLTAVSDHRFGEFWISASMTLFLVALGLLFGLVVRDQREALRRLEAGESASVMAGRIAGVSGAVALIFLVILVLMFWQPGAPPDSGS